MNSHDSRTLNLKHSKSMDLFNMIYSTNTVGEHLTGTGSNAPGYNGMFFNLIPNNLAKNNISSNNPP